MEYQICVFDNREIGRSTSSQLERMTTFLLAKDTQKVVEHLQWSKFHVVGLSMGGMIAQEFSLLVLDKMESLTLVSTHSGGWGVIPPTTCITNVLSNFGQTDMLNLSNMFSKDFLSNPDNYQKAKELYQRKIEYDGLPSVRTILNQLLCVNSHYVSESRLHLVRDSKVPVWVCCGTSDSLIRPQNSIILMDILKPVKSTIFVGVGHCPNFEIADQFNRELLDFVSKKN